MNPSSGIVEGAEICVRIREGVKAVKVHKQRLFNLARRCDELLTKVGEHSSQLVGPARAAADEIERVMRHILNRVLVWAGYSNSVAFLKRNDIRVGIDECESELSSLSTRFTMTLSLVNSDESRMREEARQHDHRQMYDLVVAVCEEVRQIRRPAVSEPPSLLSPPQVNQRAVPAEAQEGANQVVISPPPGSASLSGKVTVISGRAEIEGRFLDFCFGEWTDDGDSAALGRPRNQSPTSQMHFKEKVDLWRGLHHRNVLSFFGHVEIENIVYSVSPWMEMENRNIRDYVRGNPDADRMRLLSEVASGMEFLHEKKIVHGDLCGKNVLISGDGQAFICEFNLSESVNPFSDISRARWLAPERIKSGASATPPTFKADVWSFGLLCLEVFTDADPYRPHPDDFVLVLLGQGKPPENPRTAAVGLSSKMWGLMQSCWEVDPVVRHDMVTIQLALRNILPRVARPPSISPAQTQSSLPTIDGSSERPSIPAPLTPPPTNRGSQLTPEPSTTTPPPPLNRQDEVNGGHKRGSIASSLPPVRLPTLPEDDHSPVFPPVPARSSPIPPGRSRSRSRESTAPNPSPPSPLHHQAHDLQRHTSVDSAPPPAKERTGWFHFHPKRSHKRSHTTTPGTGDPVVVTESPPKPSVPSRSQTTPAGTPNVVFTQPLLSATDLPISTSTRQWVPVSHEAEVRYFLERVASEDESLPRLANGGSVSAGNLEDLLSRVMNRPADPLGDENFIAAFLTIYRLFATNERLFEILKRRFELKPLDPAMAHSRYRILLFIERWLKKGFEDPELTCSSKIREFARSVYGSHTMEAKAKEIVSLVDDPDYIRLRKPESCPHLVRREPAPLNPRVTPPGVANALTVIEGKRFKSITYWDYVNFILQPNTQRIDDFKAVHNSIETWVQRTVLGLDYVDERMVQYQFWISTAQECHKLNNFSSTSAIVTALSSPTITRLVLTCESKGAERVLRSLDNQFEPTDDPYRRVIPTTKELTGIPSLVSHLNHLKSTFVQLTKVDGPLSIERFSELAEQVDLIVRYTPPRIEHATPLNVLAYVEDSLVPSTNGDTRTEDRSDKLASKERQMFAERKRRLSLGFPWSPPRRK